MILIIKQLNTYLILVSLLISLMVLPVGVKADSDLQMLDISVEKLSGSSVKIKWRTDQSSTGTIRYGLEEYNLNAFITDNRPATWHEVTLGNLVGETTYYYQITASNSLSETNSFVRKFKTDEIKDSQAPNITNRDIPFIAGTLAVVTWDTNEAATTFLEYGRGESLTRSISSSKLLESHQVVIKGLSPGADYLVRYYSKDKQGNRSSVFESKFTTRTNDNIDQAGLMISDFRPNSLDDPNVGDTSLTISFKTNRWAKGRITLAASGVKTKSQDLDYNTYHTAVLENLKPATKYNLTVYLTDVYGKKLEEKYTIETRTQNVSTNNITTSTQGTPQSTVSSVDFGSSLGYYGEYFNLRNDTPGVKIKIPTTGPIETGWYNSANFVFDRIDPNLKFGCNFFPINSSLPGDPHYFSVHWSAYLEVPLDGIYSYDIRSDDDSWVFIDGNLLTDLRGIHPSIKKSYKPVLSQGIHTLDIYYAERAPRHACMSFIMDDRITVRPRYSGFINGSGGSLESIAGGANSGLGDGIVGTGGVIVAGISNTVYTPSSGLFRTPQSPDVYTIMNSQRHYISSPGSFNTYAYRWEKIKTISRDGLEKYPRARLIKSPDKSTIYFLFQKPENKWLKIALNSPTVFVSYPSNYWGNVITVTEQDVVSYPEIKFIKTADNPQVYYLKNSVRHAISQIVFNREGYNPHEVAVVNQVHMDSYLLSDEIK